MHDTPETRVPLTDVTLGEEEAQAAGRVIRSGWVTMGHEVSMFEQEFAGKLGVGHAIAVTNGTAALHLAYIAAGLGRDHEFLMPGLTFIATLNAGLYCSARPVLVDISSENDLTLCPRDVENKITDRTRLIVTMAYGGFCPDMQAIIGIAGRNGLSVVEDACHAPLARLDERPVGGWGDAGAFSFFGNKNLSIGEGGMLVTDSDENAALFRKLRTHGMSTTTWDRHQGHATQYDIQSPGYNYRMDEIRAAVGREQLKKLPAANQRRCELSHDMRERLAALDIPGLVIPFSQSRGTAVHHLFVILLPAKACRDKFRKKVAAKGIQTSIHYPPLDGFTHTRSIWEAGCPELPRLRAVLPRLVTLPMGPTMTDEQVELVCTAVGEALA
jgi:dTDP-4-amino-4,6-dideoxygalactose transaminase